MSRLMRNRVELLVAVGAGLVVVATWAPRTQGPLDLRYDAGVHYVLGTSLAQGKGYRLLNEPGEVYAVQYPPGFPSLIAAHQVVLGTSDPLVVGHWLRLTLALSSVGYVLAAYRLLRLRLPPRQAALGGLVCATSPLLAILGNGAIPDIPFAMVATLFVICVARSSRGYRWLTGALAVGGFLLRTAGIGLLAVWMFESATRRDIRGTASRATVAAAVILAWHAYIAAVESSPAYRQPTYPYQRADYLYHNVSYATNIALRDPFRPELGKATAPDYVGRVIRSLALLPQALGEAVSAPSATWATQLGRAQRAPVLGRFLPAGGERPVLALLGAIVIGGLMVEAARGSRTLVACVVATVAVVIATPWPNHWARYLVPVAPLLVLSGFRFGEALTHLASRRIPRRPRRLPSIVEVAACLVLAFNLLGLVDLFHYRHQAVAYHDQRGQPVAYRLFFYRDTFEAFDAGLDWLRQHARPSDVVASTMPHWVYLRTGLLSVMPPADTSARAALSLLDAVPVTYVMDGGSTAVTWARAHAFPAVRAADDRWASVYSDPGGQLRVYRRLP